MFKACTISITPFDLVLTFSGAYTFEEVFSAGGSEDMRQVLALEKEIQMDDAVNIQFTSVGHLRLQKCQGWKSILRSRVALTANAQLTFFERISVSVLVRKC